MEPLSKIQFNLNATISKARSNFKKSPKDRITVPYVETRLEALEASWAVFNTTHHKIIAETKESDYENSDYCTKELYEVTEELYIEYKAELKENLAKLSKKEVTVRQTSDRDQKVSCNVKLPKIELPMFSGKYNEWITFRDLFSSLVHKNPQLDDIQRLQYLKTHLKGEAEQLLRHIPITADNYSICWAQLENRYNNKRYLANCILKRLLNQKNVSPDSAQSLKELLDTTNECLHALRNIEIDVDSWDVVVIFNVSQRLDNESRKQWELYISDFTNELPTLNQFNDFIEKRYRALEFVTKTKPSNVKTLHVVSSSNPICTYCSEEHKLSNCKGFAKLEVNARREFVQSRSLCFNCLGKDHRMYSCRQKTRCQVCKKKHHSLLHRSQPQKPAEEDAKIDKPVEGNGSGPTASTSSQSKTSNAICCHQRTERCQVLLATALVDVQSNNGTALVLRSLLDQGSQASFITESAVQMLGLKKIPYKGTVSGIGGGKSTLACKATVLVKVQSRRDPDFVCTVKAHVLNKLTGFLPEKNIDIESSTGLPSTELADPSYKVSDRIDLLLGAEVYGQILLDGIVKGPPGTPIAQNTRLGWILSGWIFSKFKRGGKDNFVGVVQCSDDSLLKRFWELEAEPTSVAIRLTIDEERCEEIFRRTTRRDETGRFVVRLPFKTDDPKCKYGNSRDIARRQFLSLERRLSRDPDLKKAYSAVMEEYLQLGHMEEVEDSNNHDAVYLPHHAVVRNDKSTTKVRVVFNASSLDCNGVSLNDDLLVGPALQPELRHLIMRWRCHPICLVADIIKMYRQVKIAKEDVDYQRIYWRDDPEWPIKEYRLLRVTFGTSAAPYLAVKSLQQLAVEDGEAYPLAAERIVNDFYMDDLMTGCSSVSEGVRVYQEMNHLLSKGGFQLQKWSSNSAELLEQLEGNKFDSTNVLEIKTDEVFKILGLTWKRKTDEFEYTVQIPPLAPPITKRKVVSDIARLFDPLGWLAPVITRAKVFIQKTWLSGIGWDEELPASLMKDWITFRNALTELTNFRIPRWINLACDDKYLELHGFSDASSEAYAAVVYARVVDNNGDIHVRLITSKTRVAPIKQVSIPRLELCGAALLAKLLNEVASTLKVPRENLHAWSDSLVVLAWLSGHPSKWKTFVGNRVADILTILDSDQWSYVPTEENPADCASRGVAPQELSKLELWKNGPDWLKEEIISYNRKKAKETTLELKKAKIKCHVTTTNDENDLLARFSSLGKLVRVIAYCRRFLKTKSKNKKAGSEWLSAKEMDEALLTCIRMCQRESFAEDIRDLKEKGKVKKSSKLTSLNPVLDEGDILRVGGRLQKADITQGQKHPILIPQNSPLTNLVIGEAHKVTLHGGPQLTLNYLRSKYWIVNARSKVRKHVRNCVNCVRYAARTSNQLMGQLPEARVTPCRPFRRSGLDYAGPISIRATKGRGYRSTKGYICLFVCMATKAIHLEVVSDMTSQGFLAAFKRMVSRRGHVSDLWSDNGTTFVGAARELKMLLDQERSSVMPEIAEWLATNGTTWHFIPPHAPNFGGLWEAGVKSTKHHLKRVLGNSTLTFEEMTTLLYQIEACLNSRPISQPSDNLEDASPLTPGHFLVGEPLVLAPDANFETSSINSLTRWHLTQRMVQDFWRRWSREYLSQLQQRHKWQQAAEEPKVGDVVLVREDDLPPSRWLYGLVLKKHPGSDNLTRVVTLRCKGHEIKRPTSKIIVLPVAT